MIIQMWRHVWDEGYSFKEKLRLLKIAWKVDFTKTAKSRYRMFKMLDLKHLKLLRNLEIEGRSPAWFQIKERPMYPVKLPGASLIDIELEQLLGIPVYEKDCEEKNNGL